MTPQQIEYVLLLAELKSFSKAAQALYITQPSFSKYIINIENQLGTLLFDRSTTPITLTAAGHAYVETAKRIKSSEDDFMNRLADIEKLERGTLKIGASTFRTCYLLSRSISSFCREHSGITVSITDDNLKEVLKRGEIDMIIGTGDFDPRYFDYEPLAIERLYVAVPRDNPINDELIEYRLSYDDIKAHNNRFINIRSVNLSSFAEQPFVFAQQGEFDEKTFSDIFTRSHFIPKTALRVRTIDAAFSFVTSGFGISVIPDTLITLGNFSSHPYYYAIDEILAEKPICLVMRKNSYVSRAAAEYSLTLKKLVDIGTWRV